MKPLRILLVAVGVLGAGFAIWRVGVQHDGRSSHSRAADARSITGPVTESRARTVGDAWKATPSLEPEVRLSREASLPLIDSASVREALRDVRIDASGNVVVDDRVLAALRSGFASSERLDARLLAHLQDIIRNGLPPPAGEQAATIVGNYYHYQVAAEMESAAMSGSLAESEAELERTIALRHSYFGAETAEQLFGDEQAYARFTIASMKLAADASLSAEEKARRQQQLTRMLPEPLRAPNPDASAAQESNQAAQAPPRAYRADFPARYAEFERQQQAILAAALAEEEKQAQLDRLLHEHFAADEIDLALRYDPSRDGVEPR